MEPGEPGGDWPVLGVDSVRTGSCAGCGWSGPEALMRGPGRGGDRADGVMGCPRCGSPVVGDPPSVAEILAARRGPEA